MLNANYNNINNNLNQRTFGAGWSTQIEKQIRECNVYDVKTAFKQQKINTDFKDNKVIAWCSLQTLKIFNELNKKYKLNLGLPKAILVEDFSKLKEQDPQEYGICNFYPAYLKENSNNIYPERTILFNSFESNRRISNNSEFNWENIDSITKKLYELGRASSKHFLNIFVHEFGHASHNEQFIRKFSSEQLLTKLKKMKEPLYLTEFKKTFSHDLEVISKKATESPLEAIADDISQKITTVLDFRTLSLTVNPFKTSSYPKQTILQILGNLSGNASRKESLLDAIWEGEIV